jgi:hypothetical protein
VIVNVFILFVSFFRNILGFSRKILRSMCGFKWLQKILQYVSDVGSESLDRKIGHSNTLPEDISFISENNYRGMSLPFTFDRNRSLIAKF